ncbi:muconolactone Delta-isomerase family protein [Candidatus Bipolaricaulota bacterium]
MKYLVTALPSRPMQRDQALALYKAASEWVKARLADGTLDFHYTFPGGGGIGIANVDSHEALSDVIASYPLYAYMDWEVRPLSDWSHTYNTMIERLQQ